MSANSNLQSLHQEGRILLAIQAIKRGQIRSILAAAKLYDVHYTTLRARLKGRSARCDSTPINRNLTFMEELALVQ